MEPEKIQYSEEVDEVLSYVPNWMIRWGITLIFGIIILFLFLSWLIKYPDVVASEVVITTETQPIPIICKSEGILKKIFVSDGQEIKKGDVLAYMDNEANYEHVLSLIDLIDKKEDIFSSKIIFPKNLQLGSIQLDYNRFLNAYLNYWLNKEVRPKEKEVAVLQIQLENNKVLESQLEQKQILFKKDLKLSIKDAARDSMLHAGGHIADQNFEMKQIKFIEKQRAYQDVLNQISNIKISISQINREIIALSDINNEILYKNEQTTLLEFEQLKGMAEKWKNNYLFISPINGKISFNKFIEDNIYLNRNDNVFTIIPIKGGKVEGNAEMPISKSGKVRVGQKVNIKLANFPYGEYGMLVGKIKSISLTPSNDKYILSIELPNGLVSTYGKELNFKQNMKGIAEIITEDLRLIERLFYQFRKKMN